MSYKILVANPKDRIIDLENSGSDILKKLDNGTPDEHEFLENLNTHWIVFIVKCHSGIYGVLIADKDLTRSKSEQLKQFVNSYFIRLIRENVEIQFSNDNMIECNETILKKFPTIYTQSKVYNIYKFY